MANPVIGALKVSRIALLGLGKAGIILAVPLGIIGIGYLFAKNLNESLNPPEQPAKDDAEDE